MNDIVYIPIDAKVELPTDIGWHSVDCKSGRKCYAWFDGNQWADERRYKIHDVEHWLKPVPLSSLMDERAKWLLASLQKINQMSDSGSAETTVLRMKGIASEAINKLNK